MPTLSRHTSLFCVVFIIIFLPLSIVTDGLKHKVNKTIENAMSCNHKDE